MTLLRTVPDFVLGTRATRNFLNGLTISALCMPKVSDGVRAKVVGHVHVCVAANRVGCISQCRSEDPYGNHSGINPESRTMYYWASSYGLATCRVFVGVAVIMCRVPVVALASLCVKRGVIVFRIATKVAAGVGCTAAAYMEAMLCAGGPARATVSSVPHTGCVTQRQTRAQIVQTSQLQCYS